MELSVQDVGLHRLSPKGEAGLWICSFPWPRKAGKAFGLPEDLSFGGGHTGKLPLGKWPGSETSRRVVFFGDAIEKEAPDRLALRPGAGNPSGSPMPEVRMVCFEKNGPDSYACERHLLRVSLGDRELEMALGIRTGGGVHWWEACGLVILRQTEAFIELEMGGAIPVKIMTGEELRSYVGFENPYLHKHNWINGNLYLRIHRNGVCEVYAHHVNAKCFDDGADFQDVVPVVGFRTGGEDEAYRPWSGEDEAFVVNDVRMDLSEAARLATREQPGALGRQGGFLIWQAYTGVELYGGDYPEKTTGDPYIFHAEERIFPRGMARTLRFTFSLSDRSPKVARYQAPGWWYGLCEELYPKSGLPVRSVHEPDLEAARKWVRRLVLNGGFEDGAIPRHARFQKMHKGRLRNEAGWEGDLIYALFLDAWRTGRGEDYDVAIRAAFYYTDVSVDHAVKLVRMHGYPPHAFSLPGVRMQATIAAYLETGDPYLLRTAEATTIAAHWLNLNSWPRLALGRDSCYLRAAILLYRYFDHDFYRRMALEGALQVAATQRENGSFGDQGGGAGIHQWNGYITKPWMGLLAVNPLLDYLELFPEEAGLQETVKRFADWLLAERWWHHGAMTWSYQHDYDGKRTFYDPSTGTTTALPTEDAWHQETLARLLGYVSLQTGQSQYLEAWAESFGTQTISVFDHCVAAALQFNPWLHDRLWNARLEQGKIVVEPVWFGERTPGEAVLVMPNGECKLEWRKEGEVIGDPAAIVLHGITLLGQAGALPEVSAIL